MSQTPPAFILLSSFTGTATLTDAHTACSWFLPTMTVLSCCRRQHLAVSQRKLEDFLFPVLPRSYAHGSHGFAS